MQITQWSCTPRVAPLLEPSTSLKGATRVPEIQGPFVVGGVVEQRRAHWPEE